LVSSCWDQAISDPKETRRQHAGGVRLSGGNVRLNP
jgi:hypothetical protein